MFKTILNALFIGVIWFLTAWASVKGPTRTALNSIRPEDVRRHIDFLASDSLMGRDTPSPGLNIAAHYIADEFSRLGLDPLDGSYLQKFYLNLVRLGDENFLKLKDQSGTEFFFDIKRDFMPFEYTANKEVESELAFVGYGITAPEFNYDDYQNIDVQGKIVIVLRHEPGEKDSTSVFNGVHNTDHSEVRTKVENAIEHGAVGLLLVTDPLNHRSLRPRGFPWPSLYRNIPSDALPYTLAQAEEKKIPTVHVGKRVINKIFGSVDSLKAIQSEIDSFVKPNSFMISDFTIALKTSTSIVSDSTQNVVAFWEGSDPNLKKDAIVIGAHYDHVGYRKGER
ncbi:MAG: PA domain-containing protein, partial [bacterium]